MFPRFPKARPWAARSPKAVTSDRFSLGDNKREKKSLRKKFIDLTYKVITFIRKKFLTKFTTIMCHILKMYGTLH